MLFFLLGGVLSDRHDRRRIMLAADAIRGVAIAAIGALSLAGALELWHVILLVGVYGAGEALFGPAFGAIVPDLVPPRLLTQANALDQFLRPVGVRLAGPALGGWLVATVGTGGAFVVDAATFLASGAALLAMRGRPPLPIHRAAGSVRRELGEGWRFVRANPWLWSTLMATAIGLLAFWGPVQVLVPYVIRNDLGLGAEYLGLVLGAGGVGAIVAAVAIGQRGLPARPMLTMYLAWAGSSLAIAAYAAVDAGWQAMLVSTVSGGLASAGMVVWMTLMHRLVPTALLGRVTSLDWTLSTCLVPVSFALTGPVAAAAGVEATLVGAGVIGGLSTLAFLLVPGVRDPERRLALPPG